MKEKLNNIKQLIGEKIIPKLQVIDTKMSVLIPNPKVKKIAYIGIGSLFGLMGLIIFLGILLSPLQKQKQPETILPNKTNIIKVTPGPQKELSETQKEILKLENEIKSLTFPQSILNIPVIELKLLDNSD